MTRKSGKNLQLWLAADDSTAPVVGDAVAYIRSCSAGVSAPSTNVTAAGDAQQEWRTAAPGLVVQLSGVADLTNGGNLQLLDAAKDQDPRNFTIVPDSTDATDGFDGTGYVEQLNTLSGSYDGSFEFTATLRCTGAFDWDSNV